MSDYPHHLEGEISLLERSLLDAQQEFDRGELDAQRYIKLRDRDQAMIERLRAQIAESSVSPREESDAVGQDGRVGRSLSKKLAIVLLLLVVAISGVVLWFVLGTNTSPNAQRDAIVTMLNQADNQVQHGKPAEALVLYNAVLKLDPTQSQALAQSGWLTFEAGMVANSKPLVAHGDALVSEATIVDPKLYAAHLYRGVIDLVAKHDAKGALVQFAAFRALHPPAKWQSLAQKYIAQAEQELRS